MCAQIKSGKQVKSFVGRFYLQVLNMNTPFVIVVFFAIIIAIAIVVYCSLLLGAIVLIGMKYEL